ncbi:hypothetical protein [Pseudoalteromonas sp. T1lg22]|uniref:hypothetical protein n=1 Tax=Pseudoalteromonas sp. T1lg22 TaxID=2077096 RepID=UPI000CF67A83|nr:hypothetical protein [Pseudoalteromonas sp. T1lg22]
MKHNNNKGLKPTLAALVGTAIVSLSGCGGSSDGSSDSGSIQLYNGTINGPTMTLSIADVARTTAELGNVTSTHSYTTDDYDFAIQYRNDQGNLVDIISDTLSIRNDTKTLLMMYGNIEEQKLLSVDLPYRETSDMFSLKMLNVTNAERNFDLYMAADDGVFEQAELVGSAMFETLSASTEHKIDDYTFYLTEAGGTTPIWQSDETRINVDDALVMAIRPSYDNSSDYLTVDIITNGNTPYSLKNKDAQAQVQFYNSMDEYPSAQFTASKGDFQLSTASTDADTLSQTLQLAPNSYSISMLDEQGNTLVDNYLLTLEQEQSALGVFYKDAEHGPRLMSVAQNLVPNSVSHQVTVVNLVDEYAGLPVNKLDIYFTLDGQPISQTEHHLDSLNSYGAKSLTLLDKTYGFYAILEDNGQEIVLHQQGAVDVTADGNYIMLLEADASTASGYKLTSLHTVAAQGEELAQ